MTDADSLRIPRGSAAEIPKDFKHDLKDGIIIEDTIIYDDSSIINIKEISTIEADYSLIINGNLTPSDDIGKIVISENVTLEGNSDGELVTLPAVGDPVGPEGNKSINKSHLDTKVISMMP